MNLKTIALAAASFSVLAIYSSGASAQATRFYNSPAEARTDNASEEGLTSRNERAINRARRIQSYGAQSYGPMQPYGIGPQGYWYPQPKVWDTPTSEVKDW